MAAYTSTQAGSWSNSAVWGGSGPPGAGDTASIGHNVTATANVTVGLTAFTTGGTPAITMTGGSLTVNAGVAIVLSGDLKHTGASPLTLGAGSSLTFKPPSGQHCVWNQSAGVNSGLTANGTSGSHAAFATDISLGGLATNHTVGQYVNSGLLAVTYCDFSNFGTATLPGLQAFVDYNNNGTISITNCTFTGCNLTVTLGENLSQDGNFTFTGNKFTSSVGITVGSTACSLNWAALNSPTSSTRTIGSSSFDLPVYFSGTGPDSLAIGNNHFGGGFRDLGTKAWASFDGNFLRLPAASSSLCGDMTNNVLFYDHPLSSGLDDWFILFGPDFSGSKTSVSISGNAFYHNGNNPGGELLILAGANFANVTTVDYRYNLGLPNGYNGKASGYPFSCPDDGTTLRMYQEHNTWWVDGSAGLEFGESQSTVESPNRYQSFKANLFVGSAATGLKATYTGGGADLSGILTASTADYNGGHGLAAGTGTGTNSGNGYTGYFAATLGPHDVSADPQFVDSTRSLASWAGFAGGTATDAGALVLIAANPALVKSSLLPYLRAGWSPANAAYQAASFPGDASTADAAGNAWPGSGPGIGAMGYVAPAATTYTLSLSPSPGVTGSAVTATVTPNGAATGTITLTPSGCGLSAAQTLTFSGSSSAQTATFTPTSSGTLTVTPTNSASLTNPSPATDTINAAATTYTLSLSPSPGVTGSTVTATVTPNGVVTGTITLTPSGCGLSTAQILTFSGSSSAQTATFTPTSTGTLTVTPTNSASLTNPAAATDTVDAPSYTFTAPATPKGDVTVASGNFTVTPLSAYTGTVTPSDGGAGGTFTPASLTWSGTSSAQTFTYTPARWGSHSIATANSGGLTDPAPVSYLGMVQLGRSGTASSSGSAAGNVAPSLGGFDLLGVGPYLGEMKRDVSGDALDPNSAAIMALFTGTPNVHVDFYPTGAGTSFSGLVGIPFNVVAGGQATQTITYSGTGSAGSSVPIPAHASFEGTLPTDDPPTDAPSGDRHLLLAVRDETTGGVDHLLEFYQIEWTGSAWTSQVGILVDIAGGTPLPDDTQGADAAALPMLPLLLKYEEVAGGDVGHALRATFPAGLCSSWTVYPARNVAAQGQFRARLHWGARVRLVDAWYQSNKGSFSGQARVILDAMHKYGVINADITGGGTGNGFFLEGVTDDRWDPDTTSHGIFALQNVPMSAFEVPYMIPRWSIAGPSGGPVGQAEAFSLASYPSWDSNFSTAIYVSDDAGQGDFARVPVSTGSTTGTFSYTPAVAGTRMLTSNHGDQLWYPPPPTTFAATSPTPTLAPPMASVAGPREVDLSWTAAIGGSPPYSYQARRAPDVSGSAGTYANIGPVGANLAYSDTQVIPGATYHYRVVVTDSVAATATSAEVRATTASSFTLTGPSTGPILAPSTNFTVTPVGAGGVAAPFSGTITITPGGGGLFRPIVLNYSNSSGAQSFTITPTSGGVVTLTPANGAGLANPPALSYSPAATAYTLNGPTSATVGAASSSFTVAPNAFFNGSITPGDGGAGGSFSPATLSFAKSATPATFSYTPAKAGLYTISCHNGGGLTDPAPIVVEASMPAKPKKKLFLPRRPNRPS